MVTHRAPRLLAAFSLLLLTACEGDGTTPLDGAACAPQTLDIQVAGFPPMVVPADNPNTREGVALGRRLFHDPILSADSTQSCSSCHTQAFGFSDNGLRFSVGIDGIAGGRNAPSLTNVGWNLSHFWDGRAATLEDQAIEPVTNPIEMHENWENVVAKLQRHPEYPELFEAAFCTTKITAALAVKAIAQFERTFISVNSKYDRYLRGEALLTSSELRGFFLFAGETGDCFHCHDEIQFTVRDFRDIGLDAAPVDWGRASVTGLAEDLGKFKVPTLRNVAVSAPYMHDGRFSTLEEVVEHYDSGGVNSPNVDVKIRVGRGLGLTLEQKRDLVAFLHTLTDSSFIHNPALSSPFE